MNSRTTFTTITPQHTGRSTPSTSSSTTNPGSATPATSYPTSAMSEEFSAWPQRKYGQSIRSPPASTSSRSKPGVLNIASPGAVTAAKIAVNNGHHGRLHKRSTSASSLTTPKTAAFPAFDPNYQELTSPPALYRDAYAPPSPSTSIRNKVKIKPFLNKLQAKEKTSLDLSRTAAENEGLGIYTSHTGRDGRGGSDASEGRRGYHTRTTSGTSQISAITTSSTHRSGAQYVHPMRQTPRPFTPPPAHSHQSSFANSDISSINTSDDPQHHSTRTHRQPYNSTSSSSYAPLPTLKRTPPPLHIRTYSSSRLTSSSQTNLPGTPSSLRYADTFSTPDPMPQTSRSSIDSAFRKRSRANTATDPAAQLAAVQALRAEFNAREAAKDLKIQQAEARLQQKDARRQERRDESARRKSEAQERRRARSLVTSEKSVPLSMEYSQTATVPMDLDLEAGERPRRPRRGRTATAGSATKAVGSQWSLFWFRFKTMWLKFKRSMSRGS